GLRRNAGCRRIPPQAVRHGRFAGGRRTHYRRGGRVGLAGFGQFAAQANAVKTDSPVGLRGRGGLFSVLAENFSRPRLTAYCTPRLRSISCARGETSRFRTGSPSLMGVWLALACLPTSSQPSWASLV